MCWNEERAHIKCTKFCFRFNLLCLWLLRRHHKYFCCENWRRREACAFPAESSGTRVPPHAGALAAGTDGVRKLNCANVPCLCFSLNRCPILMLLRSWNSQWVLLIHIPHHLIEVVLQFNLKHEVNWSAIKIKWPFPFYVEGDYIIYFAKAHRTEIHLMNFSYGFSFSLNLPCTFLSTHEASTAEGRCHAGEAQMFSRCGSGQTHVGGQPSPLARYVTNQRNMEAFIVFLLDKSAAFIGSGFFFYVC